MTRAEAGGIAGSGDVLRDGWCRFPVDDRLLTWVGAALPAARAAVADPAHAQWLQCGGTWFVGVDVLPNQPDGSVSGIALEGAALEAARGLPGGVPPLHQAQVSVMHPGYPRPRKDESDAAFGYRLRRDAAHVDGILAEGPDRRRHLREPHAWILGLPLTQASADAAPLVVWEGSHEVIRTAFRAAYAGQDPARWPDIDVTEAYGAARRQVFDTCKRVEIAAQPGEAYLVHRLALHGVAPWGAAAQAGPDGRMIAYFRPLMPGGAEPWLTAP